MPWAQRRDVDRVRDGGARGPVNFAGRPSRQAGPRRDRAPSAQDDPTLRLLVDAKIFREVWAIFESRLLGPGSVSGEFRNEDVRGLGEDFVGRLHRGTRAGPQIVAASRRPTEQEGEGIPLVEDNDAAMAVATVTQQGGCLDDRLDIFGG